MITGTALCFAIILARQDTDYHQDGVRAAESGDLKAAIKSFRLAAQSSDSTEAWFNLGVTPTEQAALEATHAETVALLVDAKECLRTSLRHLLGIQ
jgi:hypothetical protein